MPTDEALRLAARHLYPEVEVEDDADISTAPDGAYVEAWVWVPITDGHCAATIERASCAVASKPRPRDVATTASPES